MDWYNKDTIYLNHYDGGAWGDDYQLVEGIKSIPGTILEWLVCTRENDYTIAFNGMDVATYTYRSYAAVTRFEYTNNGYDSGVTEMCVQYILCIQ